jgi:hypothetical protein
MPGDRICIWRPASTYLCKAGKPVKLKKSTYVAKGLGYNQEGITPQKELL